MFNLNQNDNRAPVPVDLLPKHLAIIMDGNGRWAKEQGAPREEGHKVGSEVVNNIVRICRRWGIQHLTLYAFSEQNWGRPKSEIKALMKLLDQYLREQREDILENRIRLKAIGDLSKLPFWVRTPLQALIQESAPAQGMTLTLALSYGGREEIIRATQHIAEAVQRGQLKPTEITEATIQAYLYEPDQPAPDLIIRTSGEQRLSNFLLWQCAYAELDFLSVPWPLFNEEALKEVLIRFASRERRFGLTSAQLNAK